MDFSQYVIVSFGDIKMAGLTKQQIDFRLQVAYALRNHAENWEIKDLAREYIKNEHNPKNESY